MQPLRVLRFTFRGSEAVHATYEGSRHGAGRVQPGAVHELCEHELTDRGRQEPVPDGVPAHRPARPARPARLETGDVAARQHLPRLARTAQ